MAGRWEIPGIWRFLAEKFIELNGGSMFDASENWKFALNFWPTQRWRK